ncbi:MAG: sigma-54-dependent Fis family transcriptional regulator [Deltaproteobacteria bacterium]|nr:sigma-54-dependent Fis family transcriptional regulator [Deltaproteobacteria bacterium]
MQGSPARILIVDDEEDVREVLSDLLTLEGYTCLTAHDGETALKIIFRQNPDLLLLDYKMPGMDGIEVLGRVKDLKPGLPVVMLTGYGNIAGAVKAMKSGAQDYLAKPFLSHELIKVIQQILKTQEPGGESSSRSGQTASADYLRIMMGPSDPVFQLICEINRVAKSDFNVIIQGETGSGKELVAQAIHQSSPRAEAPFIPVDCGAIPETLFESELFGYEKGAFTGAQNQQKGKYETACGGTLFLDEISNMPLASQAKLLRVLQEKVVYRVGGHNPTEVDVRVLVASNQDLEELAAKNLFRPDLLFRLDEFFIRIPPLRERKEDILYLADRFLDLTNSELKKEVKGFSESAQETLKDYQWPGNVRQLRSTIRRAVLLADELIEPNHLDIKKGAMGDTAFIPDLEGLRHYSLKEIVNQNVKAIEREVLVQVLKSTNGNKAKAARILQIDYKTIQTKLKQFGLFESVSYLTEKEWGKKGVEPIG